MQIRWILYELCFSRVSTIAAWLSSVVLVLVNMLRLRMSLDILLDMVIIQKNNVDYINPYSSRGSSLDAITDKAKKYLYFNFTEHTLNFLSYRQLYNDKDNLDLMMFTWQQQYSSWIYVFTHSFILVTTVSPQLTSRTGFCDNHTPNHPNLSHTPSHSKTRQT